MSGAARYSHSYSTTDLHTRLQGFTPDMFQVAFTPHMFQVGFTPDRFRLRFTQEMFQVSFYVHTNPISYVFYKFLAGMPPQFITLVKLRLTH